VLFSLRINVVDMWNDLKDRFRRGDRIRVAQLQQEISNMKQGSKKVTEYFTELRGLWEELDKYRPMPHCTCPIPCSCLAMRNAKGFRAEDRIIQFLIGLNEEYQSLASQVLLMEPLPQINRVFSMIMQQERKTQFGIIAAPTSAIEDTNTGLVNVVDAQRQFGRGRGGRSNGRVCSFCGRSNHTIETCYKKHGFPPNWGREGSNSYGSSSASANMMDSEEYDSKGTSNATKNDDGGMMLTRDEYQILMALLEKNAIDAKGSASMMKASNSVANSVG